MTVRATLKKAKSCFELRHPNKKDSNKKFGNTIDRNPSYSTFDSHAGFLESDNDLSLLTSNDSINESHEEFNTPRTHLSTSITIPEQSVARLDEVMRSNTSSGHQRVDFTSSDVYLLPKVSGCPPSLGLLRPVSPFDLDFIDNEVDSFTGAGQPSNDLLYERDSGLGESLRSIVSHHAARNMGNSNPNTRDIQGNMSLFPPIIPQADRKWGVHPAMGVGKKTARDAGRAPSKEEVRAEKKHKLRRFLRHVPGKEELKKSNEAIASLGNSAFAYFRG